MFLQNKNKTLSFDLLEDVMNLPETLREKFLSGTNLHRIGPLIEYMYQTSTDKITLFNDSDSLMLEGLNKIVKLSSFQEIPLNTSLDPFTIEFCKCYESDAQQSDGRWFAFCKRLQEAASKSGLHQEFAKALVATFEEMVGNVVEHSEFPKSGLVGYRWNDSEFEYLVADSGIGVLKSLLKSPEYNFLSDSGEALEITIQDGKSRYGSSSGRGFGFHKLLKNIANRKSYLRFRSGDHYYAIDGTRDEIIEKTKSCTQMNGFLISVVCKS